MKRLIATMLCIALVCTTCAGALGEKLSLQAGYFNKKTWSDAERANVDAKWYLKYNELYPDVKIDVIKNQKSFTTRGLKKLLHEKKLTADLFNIRSSNHDHRVIMSSGLCMDLTNNQVIGEILAQMHPKLVEACTYDGKVYGVPMGITPWYFTRNKYVWEAAGLTEEDIPTSYTSLLDFLERWCERIKNKQENFCLYYGFDGTSYNATSYTNWLTELLVENYCLQCESQGIAPTFNTPEFIELLERTKKVGASLYDYENSKAERYLFGITFTRCGLSGLDQLISLRMTDDDPIFIKCNIEICAMNANSKNEELSASFLGFYMDFAKAHTYDLANPTSEDGDLKEMYASLFMDIDQNIPSVDYSGAERWAKKVLDDKALIADDSIDAAAREKTEKELPIWEDVAKEAEDQKYFASLDDLALYRSLMQYFFFPSPDNFYERNKKEIRTQRHYYSQGKITVERFVQRLDKLVE